MVAPPALPEIKRKWYGLALRHLRMASRLYRAGFSDGTVFHTYHAYECTISALIAAKGYQVPPEGKSSITLPSGRSVIGYPSPRGGIREPSSHKARLLFFNELADRTRPYYRQHRVLSRFLRINDRMDALYYDATHDRLPHQVYDMLYASQVHQDVRQFAEHVWHDIR